MTDDAPDPAIERVRRELAHLGRDDASAPPPPPEVTARIGAALQTASRRPAHTITRPRLRRGHLFGLILGVAAAGAGVAVGASVLADRPAPPPTTGPTADSITVARPPSAFPLSTSQIVGLLTTPPDYGTLPDPARRAACLDGLGHPGAEVLGAAPLDMAGRPAQLLLLPGDTAEAVVALVVEPSCPAAHSGLLAGTVVRRP